MYRLGHLSRTLLNSCCSQAAGKRFAVQRYETIPATELNGTELGNYEEDVSHSTTDDEVELNEVAISRLDQVQEEEGQEGALYRKNSKANNEVSVPAFFHSLSLPTTDGTTSPTTTSDLSPSSLPVAEISSKVAKRGRLFASRQKRRLVFKDGSCNVSSGNVTKRNRKYLIDIFTTLVDMKWRYNLLMFSLAFVLSWVIFGVIWYVIAVAHGDHLHPPGEDDWKPCVDNVHDFVTALLFSIETQHTIGYGFRCMTPRCPEAVVFLMIQSCTGVFVQCLMTGLIFAKLSQPKRRAHTIMFSQKAVISQQDGAYCLLFRVGDMRRSHFVGTSIRALMVKDRVTKEGECIPLCQFPLDIQTEETSAGDNFVFLVWPVTVVHKINESSPLWNVSAEELLLERFEIIVILEGIVESTGMTTQVRTSYLPTEILWGHVLDPLVTYRKENGQYKIDYTRFHSVLPMRSMPECSARELTEKGRASDDLSPDSDFRAGYFTTPVGLKTGSHRLRMLRLMGGTLKMRKARREKSKEKNEVKENSHQQTAQL